MRGVKEQASRPPTENEGIECKKKKKDRTSWEYPDQKSKNKIRKEKKTT